jgi:RimJ/RimL family protein N-acetyltransferase
MKAPVLITTKFSIRAFEHKDLEVFAQYRAQKRVEKYQSWTNYTYEDALKFFENMNYSTFGEAGNWYQLAISSLKSDELLGDLAVHFIGQDQLEIGFTVAPQHQGNGVATEALSSLLDYVFSELNKHRVVATIDTKNTASYRLLEKLGFRREAHFIQNVFFKGAWGDEYQYALLRSEKNR